MVYEKLNKKLIGNSTACKAPKISDLYKNESIVTAADTTYEVSYPEPTVPSCITSHHLGPINDYNNSYFTLKNSSLIAHNDTGTTLWYARKEYEINFE